MSQFKKFTIPYPAPNNESEADILGVKLAANAGYNPAAGIRALWHLNQFYTPILKLSPFLISSVGDVPHGTLKERSVRIRLSMDQSQIQNYKYIPISSADLNAAKIEFAKIKKSLSK